MNNKIKFLRGTSDEYAVAEKDSDAIYFTTDDGKLYIGNKEISGGDLYELPIATTEILGGVMPDGTTIAVDENGVIRAVGSGKTNYIIQYGVASPPSPGIVSVTFPKTFATTPIVVVSPFNTGASIARLIEVSKRGFEAYEHVYVSSNGGAFNAGQFNLHWIAIGGV